MIGVGVGVMVLKNDKVLLGLRNSDKEKASSLLDGEGTWTMPGGKLEYRETLRDAAIRELKEETSLNATKLELVSLSDDMSTKAHFVTAGFIVLEYTGDVKTEEPDEIIKWEWFDINNLPNNIYKPSKKLLDNYMSGVIYK